MSASSPSKLTQKVHRTLDEAKGVLLDAIGKVQDTHIRNAVERVEHIASNTAAGKSTNEKHVSQARERNTVSTEEYKQYADTKTVVVRMYEVGQCESCVAVGPSGFHCECGGVFETHMNGGIPKRRIRMENEFIDSEDEDDAPAAAANKKRKTAAAHSKETQAPKTLEEFVSMIFWGGIGNWAENVGGYEQTIHDDLHEHFLDTVDEDDLKYWTDDVSSHLNDIINQLMAQVAKVVDGFFSKEEKQRDLYLHAQSSDGEPLILDLIKEFTKRKKFAKTGGKKNKRRRRRNFFTYSRIEGGEV